MIRMLTPRRYPAAVVFVSLVVIVGCWCCCCLLSTTVFLPHITAFSSSATTSTRSSTLATPYTSTSTVLSSTTTAGNTVADEWDFVEECTYVDRTNEKTQKEKIVVLGSGWAAIKFLQTIGTWRCSQSFFFFFYFRTCLRLSYCHRGLLVFLMSYHSWLLQSCSSAIESQYHTSRATIGIDLLFSMSRSCRMLVTLFVDSPKKRREHNIVVPIQSNRLTYWTLFFFAIFCLFFVNVARL